ncbi:MAG TPA: hypothetical protein VFV49_04275, partial [Thermoanaerobaculia bacterium]|nr:hypothetical protein [Thermoanaerobaculia bacterium]
MRLFAHGSLLIAFALFSHAASAVPALTPSDIAPAAFQQTDPEVASNGRGVVAVWWDMRMTAQTNFTEHPAIFATRVDEEGRSLDPFGIEIARDAFGAHIASNGNGYVVGYSDRSGVHIRHLGDDARPDAAPHAIATQAALYDLESNGSSYCALMIGSGGSSAAIFGDDGTVLRRIAFDGWVASVVATGDAAFVVLSVRPDCGTTPCKAAIVATTIASDGSLSERVVAVPDLAPALVRAVSNGSRILVSWLSMNAERAALDYVVLLVDGQPAGEVHQLEQTEEISDLSETRLSVAFDGRSFLIVWTPIDEAAEAAVHALRIDEEGEPRDAEPLALPDGAGSVRIARGASNLVLVSEATAGPQSDVVARAIPSFDVLPELPPASVIAFSATPQSEPHSATSGNVVLTVAREGDSYGAIGAALFTAGTEESGAHFVLAGAGPGVLQDGPSVAVSGDIFLTAWRERGESSTRILAKRVAANGTILDAQPLVIASDPVSYAVFADTAIASSGEEFLVVWHGADNEIRARRVKRYGTMIGSPITISRHPAGQTRERRTPAVVWTGSMYLVVWNELIVPAGDVSKQNPTRVAYRLARVTREGTVLDASESASLFELVGTGFGLTLARGADRILLATATGSYIDTPWSIDVMSLDADGNPMSSTPLRLAERESPSRLMNPAAAWDGRAFLVFWNDRTTDSRIRGARLGLQETIVSNFEASPEASYFPTAVSIDRGVLLLHTEIASDQSNVARLSARVFPP